MSALPDRLSDADNELWQAALQKAREVQMQAQRDVNMIMSVLLDVLRQRYALNETTRQLNEDGSIGVTEEKSKP